MQAHIPESVSLWLAAWEKAIRDRDFSGGAELFAEDAQGFGTITFFTQSRDDLISNQWRPVWSRTSEFTFDRDLMRAIVSKNQTVATAIAPWTSNGKNPDGSPRIRKGRCTVVLQREDTSEPWLCVHTHFSNWPSGADEIILAKMREDEAAKPPQVSAGPKSRCDCSSGVSESR